MKMMRVLIICLLAVALVAGAAFAAKHLPEERGKTLFSSKTFASVKKPCNECHPNGRGLEGAGAKTKFNIMGKTQNSLEEAVNFCIVNASKGKAIAEDSQEMKDIVAYIKSLGKKAAPGYGVPGYKAPGYGAPGYPKKK